MIQFLGDARASDDDDDEKTFFFASFKRIYLFYTLIIPSTLH